MKMILDLPDDLATARVMAAMRDLGLEVKYRDGQLIARRPIRCPVSNIVDLRRFLRAGPAPKGAA